MLQERRQFLPEKSQKLLKRLEAMHGSRGLFDRVPLVARRGSLFNSTAEAILASDVDRLIAGIYIVFENEHSEREAGMDSGGLTTEYFTQLGKELVNSHENGLMVLKRVSSVPGQENAMFKALPDNTMVLEEGRLPMYYFALGRILAMAVVYNCRGDNCVMDISLASALRKFIVDKVIRF